MAFQPIDARQELRNLAMFQNLQDKQFDKLAATVRERDLQKGEILFHKGDKPVGFFLVVRGQIKLAIASTQGQEKVVDLLGPGQSFGEAVMFMEKPYPVLAQALMDTQLLFIPKNDVFTALEKDPLFARQLLAGLSIRLHTLIQDVESFTMRSSAARVVGYLLSNTERLISGVERVDLPANKNVVASLLNLTPETLSRVFHDLTEAGLIKVEGRHVLILNSSKLAQALA